MGAEAIALALIRAVLDLIGYELGHRMMSEEEARRAQAFAEALADAKFKDVGDGSEKED